jgi:co-chaperonin GroES (HSP10)
LTGPFTEAARQHNLADDRPFDLTSYDGAILRKKDVFPELDKTFEAVDQTIPSIPAKPVTFHVLCMVPKVEDVDPTIASAKGAGIILTTQSTAREEASTVVLRVLDWGPDAFGDKTRFPTGPVCNRGDYVLVRSFTGTRVFYGEREYRVINDDHIDLTLQDPAGFLRA